MKGKAAKSAPCPQIPSFVGHIGLTVSLKLICRVELNLQCLNIPGGGVTPILDLTGCAAQQGVLLW